MFSFFIILQFQQQAILTGFLLLTILPICVRDALAQTSEDSCLAPKNTPAPSCPTLPSWRVQSLTMAADRVVAYTAPPLG